MKRVLVAVLCGVLALPGCAMNRVTYAAPSGLPRQVSRTDPGLMAEYIRQLPVGSRVRISLSSGSVVRATLMKRDTDLIVVQRRTRIPEPPVEIAVRDIVAMEIDTTNGSAGRTVGMAAASAASAALGVILLLAVIFSAAD
jgi:hypothetical protein